MTTHNTKPNPIGARGVNRDFSVIWVSLSSSEPGKRRMGKRTSSKHENGEGEGCSGEHFNKETLAVSA